MDLVEAAQTSAVVPILVVIVVEYTKLTVSVIVTDIGSGVDLIILLAFRSTLIGYNERVESIIVEVSVIQINNAVNASELPVEPGSMIVI